MKTIIILLLLGMSLLSNAQNLELDAFFIKHKHHPNTIAMAIPGWLVKFGVNISEDKEDVDKYRSVLKGLNNIRILVMEEHNYASKKEIKRLVSAVKKHQYVDLVTIKSDGTSVHVLVKEKKTKKHTFIKHLMVLIVEEDELVLVTLNGRWNKNLLKEALKDGKIDFLGSMASRDAVDEVEDVAEL
ncbi:MAG: DUF4252 domain-containing protein [Aureispira sp.]|nr:DUF4252 domain-containing protein [Aureispira sp.]